MDLAESTTKRRGRPSIDEVPLPPHVQRALVLRGNGSSGESNAIKAATLGAFRKILREGEK